MHLRDRRRRHRFVVPFIEGVRDPYTKIALDDPPHNSRMNGRRRVHGLGQGGAPRRRHHLRAGRGDLADFRIKATQVADHASGALGAPGVLRVPGFVVAVAAAARHQVAREDGDYFIGPGQFSVRRRRDAS